jgi:uncharacterized protein YbaR (Trm112 family)
VFTDLVDRLRCPRAHADGWLVAARDVMAGRRMVQGTLGCPTCGAEYAVRDGIAHFDADVSGATAATPAAFAPAPDPDAIDRLAAQLHLVEAPEPILLVGAWGALASALIRRYPHVVAFVIDAPVALPLDEQLTPIALGALPRLPLADGSVRAIALDAAHATDAALAEAARVGIAGARLVVPSSYPLPAAGPWRGIASDAAEHVVERDVPASAPVQLRRAPSQWLFDPPDR